MLSTAQSRANSNVRFETAPDLKNEVSMQNTRTFDSRPTERLPRNFLPVANTMGSLTR